MRKHARTCAHARTRTLTHTHTRARTRTHTHAYTRALTHGYAKGPHLALADTAFACACNSHGPVTVAAGAEIVFVAPARLGDVLEAEAVERTTFGRSGIYDVTVRRGDAVIAEFRGRSHRLAR